MVGSLMYAALGTRPDLSFCVTMLSKYNAKPLQMHLTAAKRALRYLNRTRNHGLFFPSNSNHDLTGHNGNHDLTGYTDSDWAGNSKTSKSVGGFVFSTGNASISWQAKSQTVVALSTLEAEYIACSNATRAALWLERLFEEIQESREAIPILGDNQGAFKLIHSGIVKGKTKHIEVKFHHSHDEQDKGNVKFNYVESAKNTADSMTKAFPSVRHQELFRMCGLRRIEQVE
jgi:hypothetical protein